MNCIDDFQCFVDPSFQTSTYFLFLDKIKRNMPNYYYSLVMNSVLNVK